METVYIETTVVSYLTSRPSRDLIVAGHQQVTREWWENSRSGFRCFISQAVADEAAKGDTEQVARRLAIVDALAKLPITSVVADLAEEILRSRVLPASPRPTRYMSRWQRLLKWIIFSRGIANTLRMPECCDELQVYASVQDTGCRACARQRS